MGLLKPKPKGRRRALRQHGAVGCPHNGHQVGWCRGLCTPLGGVGTCGRPAPHHMKGRTQRAIERYKAARRDAGG